VGSVWMNMAGSFGGAGPEIRAQDCDVPSL